MTADEMREAGANLTREQAETIAAKFRTEIGSVYEVVAAAILQQHGFEPRWCNDPHSDEHGVVYAPLHWHPALRTS